MWLLNLKCGVALLVCIEILVKLEQMDFVWCERTQFKGLMLSKTQNPTLQKLQNSLVGFDDDVFYDFTVVFELHQLQFHEDHLEPNEICFGVNRPDRNKLCRFENLIVRAFPCVYRLPNSRSSSQVSFSMAVQHVNDVAWVEYSLFLELMPLLNKDVPHGLVLEISHLLLADHGFLYFFECLWKSSSLGFNFSQIFLRKA